MAGIKRNPKLMDLKDPKEVLYKIETIKKDRDKALLSALYLTGCRIREVVPYKGLYSGLKKNQFQTETINGNQFIMVYGVPTLKKKGQIEERTIPIPVKKEMPFLRHLYAYMRTFDEESVIFPISRVRAYQIVKEHTGWFPHFLRHIRLTHLRIHYNFTERDLMQFTGWKDTKPTAYYIHLNATDIANKMI